MQRRVRHAACVPSVPGSAAGSPLICGGRVMAMVTPECIAIGRRLWLPHSTVAGVARCQQALLKCISTSPLAHAERLCANIGALPGVIKMTCSSFLVHMTVLQWAPHVRVGYAAKQSGFTQLVNRPEACPMAVCVWEVQTAGMWLLFYRKHTLY